MEAAEIQNVCRLCPSTELQNDDSLINVFDNNMEKNMMEVILVTTGIQISECDIISKKICKNCYDNVLNVNNIREAAYKQDQNLKKKCHQYLSKEGIRLPNSCITIRKEYCEEAPQENKALVVHSPLADIGPKHLNQLQCDEEPSFPIPTGMTENIDLKQSQLNKELSNNSSKRSRISEGLHSSIISVYRQYPTFKLPGKCLNQNLAPVVSLVMGEVESHFQRNNLDMRDYIAKPKLCAPLSRRSGVKQVAKKRTAVPVKKTTPAKKLNAFPKLEDTDNLLNKSALAYSQCIPDTNSSDRYIADSSNTINTTAESFSDMTKRVKNCYKTKTPIVQRQQKMRFSKLKSLCNSLKVTVKKSTKLSKWKSFSTGSETSKLTAESAELIIAGPYQEQSGSCLNSSSRYDLAQEMSDEYDTPMSTKKSNPNSNKLSKRKLLIKSTVSREKQEILQTNVSDSRSSCLEYETGSLNRDKSKVGKEAAQHNPFHVQSISVKQLESNSISVIGEPSTTSTSKPEFIQSLGLTPALGSVDVFVCKICDSQHNDAGALSKHMTRHRTCPFCKLKFKYGENKQFHMENTCVVGKVVQSLSPVEVLETNTNRKLQTKSGDAFKRLSNRLMDVDNVIILTDDDEVEIISDDDSQESQVTDDYLEPPDSTSIVRPIIRICNNTILDTLGNKLTQKKFVSKLIAAVRRASISIEQQGSQTESVLQHSPVIIKNQSCLLRNLNAELFFYKIPVTVKNGNFKVSFSTEVNRKTYDTSAEWTSLPLTNKLTLKAAQDISIMNTTYPLTFLTSQVQSSQLSVSSIQLMTGAPTMSIFLPNPQSFLPSTSVSIQPSLNNTVPHTQTINNTFFSPIQTTPLLQNYTLSMTPLPIINNQVSVQASNSTDLGSNTVSNSTGKLSTKRKTVKASSNMTTSSTNNCSEQSSSKGKKTRGKKTPVECKKVKNKKAKRRKESKKRLQSTKVKTRKMSVESTRSSKLRVKNLWELK
ncbi:uncharacterized protein LOC109544988 isoform X1 [Dendroctonus ponderosae]|uniref:uncharacterized protein LOC109544988 isoform X1 n=1 Tax=Dendroctonus ponderosae TaxID=77166 RepID=UPI0020360EFB|nr:uncharacterized protein LOC109544988 isoform X1 [Dendroctonus ponderosae]